MFDFSEKCGFEMCYTLYVGGDESRNGLFDNRREIKMERKVALQKLVKILGKSLGYRVNDKALGKEERADAQEALKLAVEERRKLEEQKTARYRVVLAADAEYQRLHAEHAEAKKKADKLFSITHSYKITVGKTNSLFFHVMAQGDSWEEVIAKLTNKKQAA